jgi:hypothetical protein
MNISSRSLIGFLLNGKSNLTDKNSYKLQRYLFVFGLLFVFVGFNPKVTAQTTVVVNQTVAQGWVFYDDDNDKIDPTLGSFVSGPADPPEGTGSVQFSVTGTQRKNIATYQFASTPLADITTLAFSTYNPSAGNDGGANRSGYLHFNVSFDGMDTWQRRLVYVPSNNGTVVPDSWQEWDAFNGGNALWQYSGPTWPAGISEPGTTPGTTLKTWSQILAHYPAAQIRDTDAFMGVRVGEPYNDGYTENIDAFKFGTASGTTTYDFEPTSAINISPTVSPNPFDNDYTRINNAVQAITSGGTVTLNGTFDWAEPNAAASWALGSDGQTGGTFSDDDYSILAPGGLNGVTVTANSLGDATIQGPGDVDGINLEGVFQFYSGGTNQNWTISNLRFLDFDNAIGFYFAGGGTNVYDGTQILNNYILTARDSNATAVPGETFQNIGIHYSFGDNIVISGNTIEVHGDGVSDSANLNYSTEVGMQSNTSSGAYEGLQITNNIVRVLNAQSVDPQVVLGIWENGHGHTRNMTISGNQFLNADAGNNPALNLQRGFRVTSHSSGSSTILYSNNRVEGANIGFQWLSGQNFSAHQPVVLTSNVILNNDKGVLVDSGGSANLSFNRIVGNSAAGVENATAGTVTAENNWWGCNYGPGAGGSGCSGTANGVIGTVDADPWLVLTTSASPNALESGQMSAISSELVFNSDSNDTSGSGTLPDGTPAGFAGMLGTVAPMSAATTAGVTGTTFTAGASAGSGGVDTTVDGQTVNAPIAVSFNCSTVTVPTGLESLTTHPSTTGIPITIPVNFNDASGCGAISADFTFTYDPAVLTPDTVTAGSAAGGGAVVTYRTPTSVPPTAPGTVIVSVFNSSPFAGVGPLVNMNFRVIGPIGSMSDLELVDFRFNGGLLTNGISDGDVTVISGTITGQISYGNPLSSTQKVHNVLLNAPGTPTVSDTTDANGEYSLSGFGPGSYTVTPSKTRYAFGTSSLITGILSDDATLIAQHVVGIITLTPTQLAAAKVSGTATPALSSFDAALIAQWIVDLNSSNPINQTGKWVFTPASVDHGVVTADAVQNYTAILMGDVNGSWTNQGIANLRTPLTAPTKESVNVSVPRLEASSGSALTVPLRIENLRGRQVGSYQFEIEYDPEVLEAGETGASIAGTNSEGLTVMSNAPKPGLLKVVVYGAFPVSGDGVYVNLNFSAIGEVGARTPLTIRQFLLNDGTDEVYPESGEVTVAASANNVIRGRLYGETGQTMIRNARVTLTSSGGAARTVVTGSLGQFEFGELVPNETYTISAKTGRYRFTPVTVTMTGNLVELEMRAEP